jgi:hypothetical protein
MMTTKTKKDHPFKNVAIPEDDHALLWQIANDEERSMARQLSVMIRKAHAEKIPVTIDHPG